MADQKVVATNKKALHDFYIEKSFEAGLELAGSEVKSIRTGKVNLKGSFARVEKGGIYIYNMHITPYKFSREELDPLRPRRLLMHKSEIRHIAVKLEQQGCTLVPLKIYFKRGYAKVEVALARGKKFFDKREALKEKQVKRETDRELHRKK